ncbi:hypothetical protein GQR58_027494 [Nymphon striatum]|nr:hypothetical protein GQR58_027494 [Nymphon striatum]
MAEKFQPVSSDLTLKERKEARSLRSVDLSDADIGDRPKQAPKTNIGYDLMYPQTPTNPDVVKTSLDYFVSLNLKLGQSKTLITCDQAIYDIIKGLVRNPVRYKEVFEEWLLEKDINDHIESLSAVSTLLECVRTDCEQQDKDSVVRHVGQVRNHLNSLLIVWEEFENSLGKTAKLWEMYIDMVLIFKRYINAERALKATPR